MSVNITDSAKTRINTICEQYPNKFVRFSIESGGCQGFSKVWDIDDNILDDDVVFDFENGKLLIDPITLEILNNATIDYKMEFHGSIFTVDIPQSQSNCGCGTSFSI